MSVCSMLNKCSLIISVLNEATFIVVVLFTMQSVSTQHVLKDCVQNEAFIHFITPDNNFGDPTKNILKCMYAFSCMHFHSPVL